MSREHDRAGHRYEIGTDLMFAPWLRAHLSRSLGSDAAGRLRSRAERIQGTCLTAPTAVRRTLNWASRRMRSSLACSLAALGTAQQPLDLQRSVQTRAQCSAWMVYANLTADSPTVYHP